MQQIELDVEREGGREGESESDRCGEREKDGGRLVAAGCSDIMTCVGLTVPLRLF